MATSTDIVNQAILLIGDNQEPVTGVAPDFDDSEAGRVASVLYYPCVATVARQFAWDFQRAYAPLAASGNAAPDGWAYEYLYPESAVQIWQVKPPIADPNNPSPENWLVGNALVSNVQRKVIWSNTAGAVAVFGNLPREDIWDAGFREAVVRLLASEMADALAGKPDTAQRHLESGGAFSNIAQGRDS